MESIKGLTVCVGDTYAAYFKRSLPVWERTLDSLLVVTDEKTFVDNFQKQRFPFCLITDVFTRHGASFNKGAALCEGFAALRPDEWILNFDADVLPPNDWRKTVEGFVDQSDLRREKLFGSSHRYREDGSLIPDADHPNLWGFFHLWNLHSRYSWQRPVYDPTCGHAGNIDHIFMMQWPESERVDLWPELHLIHLGEPRQQWFGRDPKNAKKMNALFTLGLWNAWLTRAGHIKPPKPQEIEIDGRVLSPGEIVCELDKFTDADPFKYSVTVRRE